jgi:hypothetical protein
LAESASDDAFMAGLFEGIRSETVLEVAGLHEPDVAKKQHEGRVHSGLDPIDNVSYCPELMDVWF